MLVTKALGDKIEAHVRQALLEVAQNYGLKLDLHTNIGDYGLRVNSSLLSHDTPAKITETTNVRYLHSTLKYVWVNAWDDHCLEYGLAPELRNNVEIQIKGVAYRIVGLNLKRKSCVALVDPKTNALRYLTPAQVLNLLDV